MTSPSPISQRPQWSFKTLFISFLVILGFATTIVLVTSHSPLWLELEMVLGIIAVLMFHFYWWVLYHGVEFTDDEHFKVSYAPVELCDPGIGSGNFSSSGASDLPDFVFLIFFDLILILFLGFALCGLFWLGVNAVLFAIMLIATPLFFIFRHSIKFVLRNSPRCQGNLADAALFSALFTAVQTFCVLLVIVGVHYFIWLQKSGQGLPGWH